ncbi:MAG: oligopeptide transporter, OPT family [Thermoanaerobaculia bacterium]
MTTTELPPAAGGGESNGSASPKPSLFEPFIPARAVMRELTIGPLILGTILGMIFGASSLYLVLKVGLTVSASIPVAVISITLFKIFSKLGGKEATILENNIVQTAGSAGESIAFGVGVTMPAIMILGFNLEIGRVMIVAVLGGLLGILMMIPLRRALIVQQHGLLKYPEGTACAEVLKAGASPESKAQASDSARRDIDAAAAAGSGITSAHTIFTGFGIGLVYKAAMAAFKAWKDIPEKIFAAPFRAGSVSAEISPELMGVGYIIGPRIAAVMAAGGVLAYLVFIPMIKFFGAGAGVIAPGTIPIAQMSPNQIRGAYVLYIGAGAVAAAGIISVLRALPTIWHGIKEGLKDVGSGTRTAVLDIHRTEHDLPMKVVFIGIIALVIAISLAPPLEMNPLGAILIVVFGFLFVTVSSRLTGEIGSSSNPISGMTVATLLLTCLIFLVLGWTSRHYFVTALSVGAIVCIAASNGGTTSQDLKTGFLVGATPRAQQIAILVGALASALVLGPILLKLNSAGTIYVPRETFTKADLQSTIDPAKAQALPLFQNEKTPGTGPYHLLAVGGEGEPTAIAGVRAGNYLVDDNGRILWRYIEAFPPTLVAPASEISTKMEGLSGAEAKLDSNKYRVWFNTNTGSGLAGKYLVDAQGRAMYLVDPGINGVFTTRPDGTTVTKFNPPQATLMSYIIKGILNRELPWALVLFGVMIALVLELSQLPALAFAVGVYLPLSSSTPILAGGLIRWGVDRYVRNKYKDANLTEEQLIAETDKSPGVLMASGYIAGGAIAGIIIAFMAGGLSDLDNRLQNWATAHNPFFAGPWSDLLSLIPFAIIGTVLYLTGREIIMAGRKKKKSAA